MEESILNFNEELNVDLLDRIVKTLFSSSGANLRKAQELLTKFKNHEEAWTRVDIIIEKSNSYQTKFIALQILENFIQTQWNTLKSDNTNAIRCFILNVILKVSSDETLLKKEYMYINKLNVILVQILKQDWPHNWPSFISEIVASSKSNSNLCENNMIILKLLSEELFDFSSEQMTNLKTSNLRQSMCNEFSKIFDLCRDVLENSTKSSLIKTTLETLLRFLSWIPIGYIFETNLIQLLQKLFCISMYQNVTLKCLTEIGSLNIDNCFNAKINLLFTDVMVHIRTIIPPETDLRKIYEEGSDSTQEFVLDLSLFLMNFLSVHARNIEFSGDEYTQEALFDAHYFLIKLSLVDNREIFKICLEYWAKFTRELYEEGFTPRGYNYNHIKPLKTFNFQETVTRKDLYFRILSNLRVVMIEKMVKPEEVLIVENDQGEIVREFVKESDTIVLYKNMKEVLVYLTNIDVHDTEHIMTEKLQRQIDGTEWSWQNLSRLCWAIGSISGAMNEETERRFLVTVVKNLLYLCEKKRGKNNKAIVASNVMYIVGQYPRFLKIFWNFLKTVINKLFEFMHESHEGVQDMACDTFIKISRECKRHFVIIQSGENRPYVEEIIENIEQIISDLSPQQIHIFYKGIGYMISAQSNSLVQEELITKFMTLPNTAWDSIIKDPRPISETLNDAGLLKVLSNVLKTNISACSSLGPGYISQLGLIYLECLKLYRYINQIILQSVASQGPIALKTPKVRSLRNIKKDILKLIDTYIGCAANLALVDENLIDPFFEIVLLDYSNSEPIIRDAEVLCVVTTMIDKLGTLMIHRIPIVFEATFSPTLSMITNDFSEYPEHRASFYSMLRAINGNCFQALLEFTPQQFKLFFDSVVWGFKHTMRDIASIGLKICYEMVDNFRSNDPHIAGVFYQSYYLSILQDIFFVLTDRDHKSGFNGQTDVLAQLFMIVKNNEISVPLFDPNQTSKPKESNIEFLEEYVSSLFKYAFPHLKSYQIKNFIDSLFEYNENPPKFKLKVRDFLIQLREFAGENADLYIEEKEAELKAKAKEEKEKAMLIPGMIKPSELQPMDEDIKTY